MAISPPVCPRGGRGRASRGSSPLQPVSATTTRQAARRPRIRPRRGIVRKGRDVGSDGNTGFCFAYKQEPRGACTMKRLALVLALATTFAATSAVLTAADDDLDKQYLGRRKAADDRVAGGFLAFAKTLERKKCGERAKFLASHVLVVGSALQAKEAQGILDRIAQSPTKGQDDDLEAQIREAIAKYRKGYEDVSAYCEKEGLTAELADVKARIEKCEACALPDPKAPPPPEKKGGDAKSGDDKKSSGDELKDCLNRVNFFR